MIRLYLRFVHATTRWSYAGSEEGRAALNSGTPVILAFWHNRIAMMPYAKARSVPVTVLVSKNRDGAMIARVVAPFNISAIQGSAQNPNKSKDKGGASAIRALKSVLDNGQTIAITPDGPRGPVGSIAPGILYLARSTGLPIIPMAQTTRARRILKSWDQFHLPLPFTRGSFVYGDPMKFDEDTKPDVLAQALNDVSSKADELVDQRG